MTGPAELFARRRRDRLWRIDVELTDAELALVRSPVLVRLHRIRQAGAGRLTTGETFSRLEHTLGVHALAVRLRPDDGELRAAALLHDVGHLPLSHTLEGLAGLDHHVTGAARLAAPEVRATLAAGDLDPDRVTALASGSEPSVVRPGGGRLGLDHLDGLVRCADAHGWPQLAPPDVLAGLTAPHDVPGALPDDLPAGGPPAGPADHGLHADPQTADELARLTLENARWHRHPANVGPVAVVRALVAALLVAGDADADALAGWADEELWAALLASPATAADTRRLLDAPWRIEARPAGDEPVDPTGGLLVHEAPPPYLPLATDTPSAVAQQALAAAAALPGRFVVRWP